GALEFNGASASNGGSQAWVSNANYQVLPAAGQPFSVLLWINPNGLTTGWQTIVGNEVNGSNGWYVAMQTTGPGTNYLALANADPAGSLSVTGRTLLLPGQWHQLAVTH